MVFLCFLAGFIVNLSTGVVFLALPLHAIDRFGAENFEVGLLSATAAIIYIGASFLSGRVSERLPIRWQLIGASIALGCAFYSLRLAPALWVMVVLQMISGLAMGVFWAPLEGTVSRLSPPGRVRANMGWYNLSWSAGMTIGYLGFGHIQRWGLAFHFGGLTAFTAALLLFFLKAPDASAHDADNHAATRPRSTDSRRRFFLMTSWLGILVAYVCVGAARQLFPKLARELHIGDEVIGYVYAAGLLTQTFVMAAMGRFHGWHHRKQAVLWGGIGLFTAAILVALGSRWPMFAAGHILLGAAMAVVYSASLYYSMEVPAEAHRNTSVHESLIGVGLASSLLMGWAADAFEYTRLSFFIAATAALAFVALYVVWALAQRKIDRRMAAEETPQPPPLIPPDETPPARLP